MRRVMIGAVTVLMVLAGAADAQNATGQNNRNFVLVNRSRQRIERAAVTTTDGKVQQFDFIRVNENRHLRTSGGACIASVRVVLRDGRQLRADKLNNCTNPLITVSTHGITLGTPTR